ncbi:Lysophospholipid acyltransferase family protein [Gammaproteobacteria bacterium]
MLSVEQALTAKFPGFFEHQPRLVTTPLLKFFRLLFHEREINQFLGENRGIGAFELVEKVLGYFNFGYAVSNLDRDNIPAVGRLVIVANHPLGALDALALIRLVSEVRRDLKVVANDLLMHIEPLRPLLLPVDNFAGGTRRDGIQRILEALEREEAVIFFPSGEVSRAGPTGIRDGKWKSGFLNFAVKSGAPLLPVHIDARNSLLFYGLSTLYKPLAAVLLVHEMFKQHSKLVRFRVGEPIPARALQSPGLTPKAQVRLVRDHHRRIAKGKRGLFVTERAIAHPEERRAIKRELDGAERLGLTSDGRRIYLFDATADSALLREIGRLREVTFRAVGEGSGQRRDLDGCDATYRHLVLWDSDALEVVGSYRIGEAGSIIARQGLAGLYTHSLFDFHEDLIPLLEQGLELGRSFVQPRYWGSRALDTLWQGLGAYLKSRPHICYLFGSVSISNSYPAAAKALLVQLYRSHFGRAGLAEARQPYRMGNREQVLCEQIIGGVDYGTDFRAVKSQLAELGVTIPTLYKQYSELCEPGGVRFLDFNVDAAFQECIDGFLLVEVARIKETKRRRYMGE